MKSPIYSRFKVTFVPAAGRAAYESNPSLMYQRLGMFRILMRLHRQINQRCRHSQTTDGSAERGEVGKGHDNSPLK